MLPTPFSPRASFLFLLLAPCWAIVFEPQVRADGKFPADRLHVIAVIDGRDELHVSHQKATWIHKAWGDAKDLQINGCKWNPQEQPVWKPSSQEGVVAEDLDLAGAELHKLRGRGSVQLGHDRDGLVIFFDDPQGGADTYEVVVNFAEAIARKKVPANSRNDYSVQIKAKVDGPDAEEVVFSQRQAVWKHHGTSPVPIVEINGRPWDVVHHPTIDLAATLTPETMNLPRITLDKFHGRGMASLDRQPEGLYLALEAHATGADDYDVILTVPRFHTRHLVRVKGGAADLLLGAPLRIYRFPADSDAEALVVGEHAFGAQGECLVALEAGRYQFEVLHQAGPQTLVALKTGVVQIRGPMDVDLKPRRIEPQLIGPKDQPMTWDELLVRSCRPTGAISCKVPPDSAPTLVVSQKQSYKIHAFGHSGSDFVALWKTVAGPAVGKITLDERQWRTCTFRWQEGTPRAKEYGVVLAFPGGQMEIPRAESATFFSNRQFFNAGYWLTFSGGRKAVFAPRGNLMPPSKELLLGGKLHPVASAAIMQSDNPIILENKSVKPEDAKSLWWEIIMADSQNYLLDPAASNIDWKPSISLADGRPVPSPLAGKLPFPFITAKTIQRLGNLKETLVARANYRLESAESVSVQPESFVERQFAHGFTRVPPYRDWNTKTYLVIAERVLNLISAAVQKPVTAKYRTEINWWLSGCAWGGIGGSWIKMPFDNFLHCQDWYGNPGAIVHEMLHNAGYGHRNEMNRVDRLVQHEMEQFRWYMADHPDYVPEELRGHPASVRQRTAPVHGAPRGGR
jgi:hypothetical protein